MIFLHINSEIFILRRSVQSKINHKNPAPLREYKLLNAKKYPFRIIVKETESYNLKVNQNTKCNLNEKHHDKIIQVQLFCNGGDILVDEIIYIM